jgi:hypothetical protein
MQAVHSIEMLVIHIGPSQASNETRVHYTLCRQPYKTKVLRAQGGILHDSLRDHYL